MPYPDEAIEQAPEKFQVLVSTTKGDFVIAVTRGWAPNGADRFYNLVKIGYFTDIAIFRSIKDYIFQFGIHDNPDVNNVWSKATIIDDNFAGLDNSAGRVTFAKGGINSRTTQIFVNVNPNGNRNLGKDFVPFGEVVTGIDVVRSIYVTDENPNAFQSEFMRRGNVYVKQNYPEADFIKSMTFIEEKAEPEGSAGTETPAESLAPEKTPESGGSGAPDSSGG